MLKSAGHYAGVGRGLPTASKQPATVRIIMVVRSQAELASRYSECCFCGGKLDFGGFVETIKLQRRRVKLFPISIRNY